MKMSLRSATAQYLFAFLLGVTIAVAFASVSRASTPSAATTPPPDALVTRGRYLVEKVGMCADCHSPRNEKGGFIHERWLSGSPLGFAPTVPMPWIPFAPPIAGLPTMTDAQAISFLQDGKRPNGSTPLPPMPEFRFNAEDARAVTAYLKSLKA